jgi:hypothetical protein
MIYLLTAIGLSPGGSTHLHTNNTENNTNNNRTTQITSNVEECGPCPVFASFTLAFALQLRKKHKKPSVRVRKATVRLRKTSVRTTEESWFDSPRRPDINLSHKTYRPALRPTQPTVPWVLEWGGGGGSSTRGKANEA